MSKITVQDVEYVAGLAQLSLSGEEQTRLLVEMDEILAYMDKLNSLDTSGVEPMMHAMELTNVFREDEVGPSLSRDLALRGAPMHDNEYFLVPRILEADSE